MSLLGGVVTGMIVGDSLGAIPTRTAMPATGNNATPKATGDGKPVSSSTTPRESLYHSGMIVVGSIVVLVLGSRALKDARIG